MQYTVEVGKAANEHETAPRRNYKAKDGAVSRPLHSKATTVYDYMLECVKRGGKRNAMGWRNIVEVHEEKKQVTKKIDGKEQQVDKTWLYYELSPYQYSSYNELEEIMHQYGRGLVAMGLKPENVDRLHIFAATSPKWMKTFLGAQSQAIPVVTAYDTLGEKGLIHSMVQTGTKAVFTDNALLHRLITPVTKATELKYIIHGDILDSSDKRNGGKFYKDAQSAIEKIREARPDLKIYSMDDIIEMGKKAESSIDIHPPKPEDLSCIMYTSGSTGDPKGVVLKHSNIIAGLGGISVVVGREDVGEKDRVIAFLPLAHIFELAFELITFYWGATLGYANVKTLSDVSVRKSQGDIKEFKPTIMVGVAAVWESIRKGIMGQVEKLPSMSQKIFWGAYYMNLKMKRFHVPGADTLGNIVFKKVRQATGGCLKLSLNGGGPISRDTQEFITTLLCPMLIGYGLTETMANTCILSPAHFDYQVQGDLTGAVTVKLVDVEELGYLAKKNQGEVWIKGECVMPEYYKNEDETSGAFTDDGWFKTGDIGEWTPKGHLKIIDRKKNLVKTMNGEYIALEKLESVYRSNSLVQNICVYADDTKVKPVAIVVPNEGPVGKLAVDLGLIKNQEQLHNVLHDKKLRKAILDDLLKTGKSQGLSGIEFLQGVAMFDEEWTPQNGFVTSAQKLQRKKILKAVQGQVDEIYSSQ
ncbi:LANO_0E07470g1_1 [Lachancea nothofagi CBS 11611]|uniref:LANO_0E07470g1_1 n=1 Tax=Lachancea nothofagi CBS 11611 TaxID=1266666 RepID=A0A1G4JUU1_9SACH|nr:LANO_0E07470g1_1 [Lachancea nothofagi CBS 11611]